jgi:hypothetical protein
MKEDNAADVAAYIMVLNNKSSVSGYLVSEQSAHEKTSPAWKVVPVPPCEPNLLSESRIEAARRPYNILQWLVLFTPCFPPSFNISVQAINLSKDTLGGWYVQSSRRVLIL